MTVAWCLPACLKAWLTVAPVASAPSSNFHLNFTCSDGSMLQPVAWNEASAERWELTLECPNCWWTVDGTYDREQVHELEEQLDRGLAAVLADLKRLAHANMADQIERFAAALHADLILPEDF